MKKILVNSRKHGIKEVLVDDEDFEYLNQFKWNVVKKNNTFYATRKLTRTKNSKNVQMHRVILEVTNPKILVDHQDHNGLNNQRNNIRQCDAVENSRNRRSRKNKTSKYLGVYKRKRLNRWIAQIETIDKKIEIGRFDTEEEAARAYDKKASELFGEFANLNFKPLKP